MNSTNKALIGGGGIDGAIHEAAGPRLFDEYQQFNGYEIGECKVTSGYKLPAKYEFHTIRPKIKMTTS